jgi:carboxypeptidase Q
MTRTLRTALVALLLLTLVPVAARPQTSDAASRLAARATGGTPLMDDLRELCDTVGGRATGSPACERAVEWAVQKFTEAGVDSVAVEPFRMPVLWLPGQADAECLAPARFPLRIAAAPLSVSTPGGRPLVARVVDAGEGTDADFAKLAGKARGAIALIRSTEMKSIEDLFGEYLRNNPVIEAAKKAGAVALLFQSTRPRGLLYRHPVSLSASQVCPLPAAIVSREQGARLSRLCEKGEVRLRLTLANRTGGAYTARNVVAEIRGTEKPDEVVVLGAHLDSWDMGTGADDNGVNCALVIDVARGIKALGLKPRRTIRFVLFTGEEQGMVGSRGYVEKHAAELDNHVAVVIFDIGSGQTTGFMTNGRSELDGAVKDAYAAAGLPAPANIPDGVDGTDNFDFLLAGVPNLVANQDAAPYLPNYHAESDTFDKVDGAAAARNAALWGLAQRTDRPATRQTRAQVDELLKATKLDEQMKAFGQWNEWAAGKRGVH